MLFTDIVGSTARAEQLGDQRWHGLLDAHHATVRRELARCRGNEVKSLGDGFLATFDGPARAVRCALRHLPRRFDPLGIQVRSGLHTGEIEVAAQRRAGHRRPHRLARRGARWARRGAGVTNRQGSGGRVGAAFRRARQPPRSRASSNRWTSTRLSN